MVRKKMNAAAPTDAEELSRESPSSLSKRSRALVFISHDNRDADLAEAFSNLLTDVSAGTLKSFRSSDKKGSSGIEFGTEWYSAIMSQLSDATDVVALLTHHSTDRPWILYEAGVAKGKLDTNVLGIALGVPLERVSTGPFGQFQNCGDDEDSLTKLVIQLLKRNPDASPREEAVKLQVQVFLEGIKSLILKKGKPSSTVSDESNVAKLFEEVKIMVRELPGRVDERVRVVGRKGGMKRRGFHPMMLEEFLFRQRPNSGKHGAATNWLLFLSIIADDKPWLFELGQELYRALRERDDTAIEAAALELKTALECLGDEPFFRDFFRTEDDDFFFLLQVLPQMIDRFIHETIFSSAAIHQRLFSQDDIKKPRKLK